MHLAAKIIFPIIFLIHGQYFVRGLSGVDWILIEPWINWLATWLGVLGVGTYGFRLNLGGPWVWRIVLVFILIVDASHLYNGGLYKQDSSSLIIVTTTVHYIILVAPQIIATTLLAFPRHNNEVENVA